MEMKMRAKRVSNKILGTGEGDRICINCKSFLWMVGIGQGIRCAKHLDEKGFPRLIHSGRGGYCELFTRKDGFHITIKQIYGRD